MEKITLIIPCYNEQEVLGILYEELKKGNQSDEPAFI